MRIRVPLLFTGLLCLRSSAPAKAQYGWEKWEVAPFLGFETSGSVPVTNSLTVDRLRVDSGTSFGTFLDYRLTENAYLREPDAGNYLRSVRFLRANPGIKLLQAGKLHGRTDLPFLEIFTK
jgi:hypothetical protein